MGNSTILKIEQVYEGLSKVLSNATSLIEDSEILYTAKKYPRAYSLSHLSIEELAKMPMLYYLGILIKIKGTVDWKNFWKNFTDHTSKLINNLFWLLTLPQFNEQVDVEAFVNHSLKTTSIKNDLKNYSLYVGYKNGCFVEPKTIISRNIAEKNLKLAKLTYTIAQAREQEFIRFLRKDESEILALFEKLPDYSKENLVEFFNYFGDVVKSSVKFKLIN